MQVSPIKTKITRPGERSLEAVVAESVKELNERSILAVTSKLVSLCEGRIASKDAASRDDLIRQESQLVTVAAGKYKHRFTIAHNTLIPSAGIDESNADGNYVLWPADIQKSANELRRYLQERFKVNHVGVIITDSTCTPLRWGTTGIALAHSGFIAIHDYIGRPDLFGRPLEVSKANISGGLAAAAVVAMGEGAEQTPLCLIEDATFVVFQDSDPTDDELKSLYIPIEDDLFAPFLTSVAWERGGKLPF